MVASDADDGINSRLTYSFDPAVGAELPFFIDGKDCKVLLRMLRIIIDNYLSFHPLCFATY